MIYYTLICEVSGALLALIKVKDLSLPEVALANLNNPLKSKDIELSDHTKTVAGKSLVRFFGNSEQELVDTLTSYETDPRFSKPNDILPVAGYQSNGQQIITYDENGDPVGSTYPITMDGSFPDYFKYVNDIEGVAYPIHLATLPQAQQDNANPLWGTTDIQPEQYK